MDRPAKPSSFADPEAARQMPSSLQRIKKKRSPYDLPPPSSPGDDPLPLVLEEDDKKSSDSESHCEIIITPENLRVEWKSSIPNVSSKGTVSDSTKCSLEDSPLFVDENMVIKTARPPTFLPPADTLVNQTFFDSPRKNQLPAHMPPGSGQSYLSSALALQQPVTTEALAISIASTEATRSLVFAERRYLEAAVLSVLLLQHRVLVLQPMSEFSPRRDNALRSFPHDVAGKWCFGTDDILIFPGFYKDPSVLSSVLKEVVASLKYLNAVFQAPVNYTIQEYKEKDLVGARRDGFLVCPTLNTPGIPGLASFFKPIFTKRYFLLRPKDRIGAELVHFALLALHRLTEWTLHVQEYGIALAFAQHQHLAELCMRNYYTKPVPLRPFYPHTMALWGMGRVYCALYDQFDEKSDMLRSFAYTWVELRDLRRCLLSLQDVAPFEHQGKFPETAEACLAIAGNFYKQVRVPGCWSVYNNQRNLTSNLHLVKRLCSWAASIDPSKPQRPIQRKLPSKLLHELDGVLQEAEILSHELATRTTVHEIVARSIAARAARCKQQWTLCRAVVQQEPYRRQCVIAPLMPNFFGMQQRRSAHKRALVYAQRPLHPDLRHTLGGRLLRRVMVDSVMDTICALECKRNARWITLLLKTFISVAQTWHPPYKMPDDAEYNAHYHTSTSHEFEGFHFKSYSNLGLEHKTAFYPVMALLMYGLGISFTLLSQTVMQVRVQKKAKANARYAFTAAAPLLRRSRIVAFIVEAFVEEAKLYQLYSVDYWRAVEISRNTNDQTTPTQPSAVDIASRATLVKERLAGVFTTMRKLTYLLPLLYEYCIVVKTIVGPKRYRLQCLEYDPYVFPTEIFPTSSQTFGSALLTGPAAKVEVEKYAVIRSFHFLRDSLGIEENVAFSGSQTTDCADSTVDELPIKFDTAIFTSSSSTLDALALNDDGESESFIEERPMVFGKDFGMKYEVLAEGAPQFPLEDMYARDQVNYSDFSTYTEDQLNKIFSNFEEEKIWYNDTKLELHLAKLRTMLSLLTQTAIMDLKFLKKNSQFGEKVTFLHLKGNNFSSKDWKVSSLLVELSLLYQRFVDPEDYVVLLTTSALHKLDSIVNDGRMATALRGEFVE